MHSFLHEICSKYKSNRQILHNVWPWALCTTSLISICWAWLFFVPCTFQSSSPNIASLCPYPGLTNSSVMLRLHPSYYKRWQENRCKGIKDLSWNLAQSCWLNVFLMKPPNQDILDFFPCATRNRERMWWTSGDGFMRLRKASVSKNFNSIKGKWWSW